MGGLGRALRALLARRGAHLQTRSRHLNAARPYISSNANAHRRRRRQDPRARSSGRLAGKGDGGVQRRLVRARGGAAAAGETATPTPPLVVASEPRLAF